VAAHDLRQLRPVWRTTGRRVDHVGTLAEILRTDCSWRDHAQRLHVLHSMVIEPVTGAARNAECLSRPDVDWFSVDSPDQDSVDAIDCLFLMVVAMRRCRQALRAGDSELKGRDAAIRFVSGDQEAYRERPETDGFLRRIDAQVDGPLCHLGLLLVNGAHHACTSNSVVAAFYVGRAVKSPSSRGHEVLAERTPRPRLHLVLLQHAGTLGASVYVRTLRSANDLL